MNLDRKEMHNKTGMVSEKGRLICENGKINYCPV